MARSSLKRVVTSYRLVIAARRPLPQVGEAVAIESQEKIDGSNGIVVTGVESPQIYGRSDEDADPEEPQPQPANAGQDIDYVD